MTLLFLSVIFSFLFSNDLEIEPNKQKIEQNILIAQTDKPKKDLKNDQQVQDQDQQDQDQNQDQQVQDEKVQKVKKSETLFLKGLLLFGSGKFQESVEIFEQLIKEYPEKHELHNNLATAYAVLGNYEQARKNYIKTLSLNPNYEKAKKNLEEIEICIEYENLLKRDKKRLFLNAQQRIIADLKEKGSICNANTAGAITYSFRKISSVQKYLKNRKLYLGPVDGIMGIKTVDAIKQYQRTNNLKVTGIISQEFFDSVNGNKNNNSKDEANVLKKAFQLTYAIQNNLYNLGYDIGDSDGILNSKTILAIKSYQEKNNLIVDGKVSFNLHEHISQTLIGIEGDWTIVPISSESDCSDFLHLDEYFDQGYVIAKEFQNLKLLKNKAGNSPILITNSAKACRNIEMVVKPAIKKITN